MKHSITLEQARQMTARYRNEKENLLNGNYNGRDILSNSETFDAESVRSVLNQEGCKDFRIYYGMDENMKIHLINIGVDEKGVEILEGENSILETGIQCPPICPPPPPPPNLNE